MYMESPLLSRGLQATSTPSLGAGSHRDLGSHQDTLDVSGINGVVMDDDVFETDAEGIDGRLEGAVGVPEASLCGIGQELPPASEADLPRASSNSLSDHTPLRSTCSRSSNKSGGPAKSLFLPGDEAYKDSTEVMTSSRAVQSEHGDDDFSQDITVDVQCICGSNLVTESQLIQCVHCLHYLHTDCVNLGDSAIAEVEQGLDWFCPTCRNMTNSEGTSLFLPSPTTSSSARHQTAGSHGSTVESLGNADESYSGEPSDDKKEEEVMKQSKVGHGAKLSSGYETPLLSNPSSVSSISELQHKTVSAISSPNHSLSSSLFAASPVQVCTPKKIVSLNPLSDPEPSSGKSDSAQQGSGVDGIDVSMSLTPKSSPNNMQSTTREQLNCTEDVLAFASKQAELSPLPFTSGHQGFVSNRQYSSVSNESGMAFSPKPSHNLAQSASKEQLDCTADVLALASKLGEMSPLPFLKPRTTLFRKPKAQVLPFKS